MYRESNVEGRKKVGKILRFELQVPNPEEDIAFYTNSFGWEFEKIPGPQDYWFIMTGDSEQPGIDGGLMKSPDGATRTTNSIDVSGMRSFAYCLDTKDCYLGYLLANLNKFTLHFRSIAKALTYLQDKSGPF